MAVDTPEQNQSWRILLVYILLFTGFIIFVAVMLFIAINPRDLPSLYATKTSKATRGAIISADGFHIADTQKLYKAIINTHFLDPLKKDLFIELFSIYSAMPAKEVRSKIDGAKGMVVLSYNISEREAQYLKQLSYELNRLKIFIERKNSSGRGIVQGLSVLESGESREYPYGNLLTPLIGYPQKAELDGYTYSKGIKGLERRFNDELEAREDEHSQGLRDVAGYIILNGDSFSKSEVDGLDIKLTIPVVLQLKIEKLLDELKQDFRAKEIMLVVMNSKNGNVLSAASSNRYLPKEIKKSDYPSLNANIVEYSYEPGSVIKTIVFASMLDKALLNPYDMLDGHNGRFMIGNKVITDEHKFERLSAEEAIIHSSNIGVAQLSQKLNGLEFNQLLSDFGFARSSTPDLIYEKVGSIPHPRQLENEIYKATCSYGYGMRANLLQLARAYAVFDNDGVMPTPRFIKAFVDGASREIAVSKEPSEQVIKSSTAQRVKAVLVRTVNEGTGVRAKTAGLVIGGKTGTAHMVEDRKYVNRYNTSFIGFVNDKKSHYTIAVGVIEPLKSQFAAQTAVPVFKSVVDLMVEEGYLKPELPKEEEL